MWAPNFLWKRLSDLLLLGDKSRSCFSFRAKQDTGSGASLVRRKQGKWKELDINSLVLMNGVEGKPAFHSREKHHQITF